MQLVSLDLWPQVHLGFQPVSQWSVIAGWKIPWVSCTVVVFPYWKGGLPTGHSLLIKIRTKGAKEIFYFLRKQRICIKGIYSSPRTYSFFPIKEGFRLITGCFSHEVSTRPLDDAKKHHDFRFSGHLGHREKKLQKGIHENNWDTLLGSNISYPLPRHFWVDDVPISRYVGYGLLPWRVLCQDHLEILLRASLDTLSFQQSTACNAFIQDRKGPR